MDSVKALLLSLNCSVMLNLNCQLHETRNHQGDGHLGTPVGNDWQLIEVGGPAHSGLNHYLGWDPRLAEKKALSCVHTFTSFPYFLSADCEVTGDFKLAPVALDTPPQWPAPWIRRHILPSLSSSCQNIFPCNCKCNKSPQEWSTWETKAVEAL